MTWYFEGFAVLPDAGPTFQPLVQNVEVAGRVLFNEEVRLLSAASIRLHAMSEVPSISMPVKRRPTLQPQRQWCRSP